MKTLKDMKEYSIKDIMHDAEIPFSEHEIEIPEFIYISELRKVVIDWIRKYNENMSISTLDARDEFDVDADVRRVAITDEQIQKYNIPPAPAKRSDTRFNGFVGEHGDRAVELDAIEPDVLQEIIKNSIQALFDEKIYQEQKSEQKEKQQEIKKMIEEYFGDDLNE